MRTLRVALAQVNTTVGDLPGNTAKIIEWIGRARDFGADIVALPEMAITGYPPEDLVLRRSFVEDNLAALDEVVRATKGITAIVGFVDANHDIYNAAAIISDGRLVHRYHKQFLPNYGVFDEDRYFQRGYESPVFVIAGVDVGVNICEDIWYTEGPTREQAHAGADVIININASPYYAGRLREREIMLATRAADASVPLLYVNLVGGQDELVFDGASLLFDESGHLVARAHDVADVFGQVPHSGRYSRCVGGWEHRYGRDMAVIHHVDMRADLAPAYRGRRRERRSRIAVHWRLDGE